MQVILLVRQAAAKCLARPAVAVQENVYFVYELSVLEETLGITKRFWTIAAFERILFVF
jgi:hypothetical protein